MKKQLRYYQEEAIQSILDGFKTRNNQLCVLPTGSGKTVLFSHLIEKLKVKTLIIAHTSELLSQIHKTIGRECDFMTSEIYSYKSSLNHSVTICSFQSAIMGKTIDRFKNEKFELLIIDECHRSACKGYRRIIDELGFKEKKLLGFTATPFRTDGQSIQEIFGTPCYEMNILDMIEKGFLVDFTGYKVKTNVSLSGIQRKTGDFQTKNLQSVINTKNRNEIIVREYKKIAKNEKTIAFCCGVIHAYELKKEFELNGISCEVIEGKTDPEKRAIILEKFKDGEIQVLTNCNLLTEGFDEPSVTCLIMARPTLSKGLYMQMIGRGCRKHPDKHHCKVIEFTDNEFDVCSLESLIEKKQSKLRIREGESLLRFKERCEEEIICEDVIIEKHEIIKKTSIGQYHNGLLLESIFCEIKSKKEHYIFSHSCGSTYSCSKNHFKNVRGCILCERLSEKFGKLKHYKIEKHLERMKIYSECDCGKKTCREVNSHYNFSQLEKHSNSCGCLRKDLQHAKTDKYVGTRIKNMEILEKIDETNFKCRCLICNITCTKTSKDLVKKYMSCKWCKDG